MTTSKIIAIPTADGKLWQHFGKAPLLTIVTVADGKVTDKKTLTAPEHEHGSMPRFIQQHACTDVICGGIGGGAADMLRDMNISIHAGAPSLDVDSVIASFLDGTIAYGDGSCHHDSCGDHDHDHHHHHADNHDFDPSNLRLA